MKKHVIRRINDSFRFFSFGSLLTRTVWKDVELIHQNCGRKDGEYLSIVTFRETHEGLLTLASDVDEIPSHHRSHEETKAPWRSLIHHFKLHENHCKAFYLAPSQQKKTKEIPKESSKELSNVIKCPYHLDHREAIRIEGTARCHRPRCFSVFFLCQCSVPFPRRAASPA